MSEREGGQAEERERGERTRRLVPSNCETMRSSLTMEHVTPLMSSAGPAACLDLCTNVDHLPTHPPPMPSHSPQRWHCLLF